MELVDRVVALQGGGLTPPQGRLPAADLKSHAQLERRAEFASVTARIAALAQGILAMERYSTSTTRTICRQTRHACDGVVQSDLQVTRL
jgi:Hereditary spastic paraplegia protein strumpellin